jgi:hypothetical protein
MRTIETKVYKFDELSYSAKEKAREWWRRGQDGDNYFSEAIIEDAARMAKLMGLDIYQRRAKLMGGGTRYEPSVYWSGFWSQGDGACVEGRWCASDVKPGGVHAECGDHESNNDINRIAREFEKLAVDYPTLYFTIKHVGHYSHSNSVSYSIDADEPDQDAPCLARYRKTEDDPDDAYQLAIDRYMEDLPDEDAIGELCRDFMDWIYRSLEREYEYINADEQVDESIRINEYEFTEDGEIS